MRKQRELLYKRIKNKFWRAILAPFLICFEHKIEFFLWVMYVIFAGLLGVVINVIRRVIFLNWDIMPAIAPESSSGSFYTFSLVLIASLLAPLFISFIKKEKPHYRNIGAVFVTILILSLVLCAVFYSFATQSITNLDYSEFKNADMRLDWPQFIFFVLALLYSWYSFGYSLMDRHEEELFLSDDSYAAKDIKEKRDLSKEVIGVTSDGSGVKI